MKLISQNKTRENHTSKANSLLLKYCSLFFFHPFQPHGLYSPWNSPGQSTDWSGYPFPSPGYLPNLGIEPRSPVLQTNSLPAEPQVKPIFVGMGLL